MGGISTGAIEVKMAQLRCFCEACIIGVHMGTIESCQSSLGKEGIGWEVDPLEAHKTLEVN